MSLETDALNAQLEELLQFVYLMPVAIIKMGMQGEVQLLNPKAVQLLEDLDLDAHPSNGLGILEALVPGLGETWEKSKDQIGEICPPIPIQRLVSEQDRHLVLKLVRPDMHCTMLVLEDVTGIVEKEREISRQRQRFGMVMEQIEGYCVVMLDAQGNMLEWNPSIDRMFGGETRHMEGQSVDKLLNAMDTPDLPAVRFEHVKAMVDEQGAGASGRALAGKPCGKAQPGMLDHGGY